MTNIGEIRQKVRALNLATTGAEQLMRDGTFESEDFHAIVGLVQELDDMVNDEVAEGVVA